MLQHQAPPKLKPLPSQVEEQTWFWRAVARVRRGAGCRAADRPRLRGAPNQPGHLCPPRHAPRPQVSRQRWLTVGLLLGAGVGGIVAADAVGCGECRRVSLHPAAVWAAHAADARTDPRLRRAPNAATGAAQPPDLRQPHPLESPPDHARQVAEMLVDRLQRSQGDQVRAGAQHTGHPMGLLSRGPGARACLKRGRALLTHAPAAARPPAVRPAGPLMRAAPRAHREPAADDALAAPQPPFSGRRPPQLQYAARPPRPAAASRRGYSSTPDTPTHNPSSPFPPARTDMRLACAWLERKGLRILRPVGRQHLKIHARHRPAASARQLSSRFAAARVREPAGRALRWHKCAQGSVRPGA